jgi:serine/threonine protein kinase
VKILLPDHPQGSQIHQQFLRRFEDEADIIARLDHKHIIQIFEYNEQYGYAYLVMPYISGGSLLKRLKQQGRLPLQQAAWYLSQAADALDYAHANGVIHRDLKPGNFLLRSNGELVLSDFGIAHIMQHMNQGPGLTTPSLLLGTPEYMAPEMARGEAVDYTTDIYELGIVLYPSIQQNDVRAITEVEELHVAVDLQEFLRVTGGVPNQQSIDTKWRWLQRHEPEIVERTTHICGSYDFIVYHLTGHYSLEENWAVESELYDVGRHHWHAPYLEHAGIDPSLLPQVHSPIKIMAG